MASQLGDGLLYSAGYAIYTPRSMEYARYGTGGDGKVQEALENRPPDDPTD